MKVSRGWESNDLVVEIISFSNNQCGLWGELKLDKTDWSAENVVFESDCWQTNSDLKNLFSLY